jgi:hypothetical protein
MKQKARNELVARVMEWGDAFPPPCRCGCGEPVRFGQRQQNIYLNPAHSQWDRVGVKGVVRGHVHGEVIETAAFRAAVEKIRATKQMSIRQIAIQAGWSPGRLRGTLYSRNQYMLKSTARHFFARLAGIPAPPTPWELRQLEEMRQAGKRAAREIQSAHH